MFRHHLLIVYRTLLRDKTTFFINLIGLSTGLACALTIYLWVNDELNIDHFNEKDSQIYQVMQNMRDNNSIRTIEYTQGLLAKSLAEEMPEVEAAVSVIPSSWFDNTGMLTFDNTTIKARGQYASQDFFKIFSYDLIHGTVTGLSNNIRSLAISEDLALKLFGSTEQAMGNMVQWDHETLPGQFVVSGVFKNPPTNASDQFDVVFSYQLFFENRPGLQSWGNSDPHSYLLLKKATDVAQFNDKISGFLQSKDPNHSSSLLIRKYSDRYLYNHFENGLQSGGRIEYVRLFSLIAIFILVIASINFMNLSTAKGTRRLKEVGIKKTVGADRSTLIFQYLGESLWITLLSFMTAILLVTLFLPQFNTITGKQLALQFNLNHLVFGLILLLGTGLIAGSYPAFYLSRFNPVTVLKGKLKTSLGEVWIRKGLVIFQFAISVILIVAVLVVYRQIDFIQSKNLGYDRDNVLCFEMEMKYEEDENFFAEGGILENRMEVFLNEMKNIPGIVSASNAFHDLTGNHGGLSGIDWEAGEQDQKINFSNLEVGYDFVETLGIEMIEGRSFSRDFSGERSKIILNQQAIEVMGISEPVGKTIKVWGNEKEIIGIAGDFHYESLYEELKPCLFQLEPRASSMVARVQAGSERAVIAGLEELYHQYNPGLAFDYRFLDSDYQSLYAEEQRVSTLSKYSAGLAIIISCLGLFGLATFSVQKRLKEIGIRKVLGSTDFGIVRLLSDDFTRILIVAIAIALPLSFLVANRWLQGFAYHIDLEWWYFALAGLVALFIAWISLGIQTIKAAMVNPTECLKEE